MTQLILERFTRMEFFNLPDYHLPVTDRWRLASGLWLLICTADKQCLTEGACTCHLCNTTPLKTSGDEDKHDK
jgi:hypothetical protein